MGSDIRLRELADFIRVRRARLSPEVCGLGERIETRRTPGLRREELGRLAGLSADWIAWLEQGRNIKLSLQAASRLAKALQLDTVESEHLHALASGHGLDGTAQTIVPSTLRTIVDSQGVNPAYVTDAVGNLVLWNASAGLVFQDFGRDESGRANLLRYMFLYEGSQQSIVDWEHYAKRIVAKFRLWHDRFTADGRFRDLASELRQRSTIFDRFWVEHEVRRRSTGHKVVRHALLGELSFQYCSLQVEDAPELTLTLLVPVSACDGTLSGLQSALRIAATVGPPLLG